MSFTLPPKKQIIRLIKNGSKLDLATQNYPSRGQTAVQELYQTKIGKLFLKKVSQQNHFDCRINIDSGTLGEREFWAFCLAKELGLHIPSVILLDKNTTVQTWLDYPDGNQFSTHQGAMNLKTKNVFDCALFDWLTGQVDRHDANYLYNFIDHEIILIDSGFSFLKFSGSIPDYLKLFEAANSSELDRKMITNVQRNLQNLTEHKLKKLIPLRSADEQNSLIKRYKELEHANSIHDIIQLYRGQK